eukprot:scaffold48134_cov63-Phaeocystis_antarctica.AAC.9
MRLHLGGTRELADCDGVCVCCARQTFACSVCCLDAWEVLSRRRGFKKRTGAGSKDPWAPCPLSGSHNNRSVQPGSPRGRTARGPRSPTGRRVAARRGCGLQ